MAKSTEKKKEKTLLDALAELAAPHARKELAKAFEKQVVTRKSTERVLEALEDAFEELSDPGGSRRRAVRRVRDMMVTYMDSEVEREVDDPLLRQAVRVVRENVIGRKEKERLGERLAEMLVEDWARFSPEEMESIAGEGGLIETLKERSAKRLDAGDKVFADATVELGTKLVAQWLRRLPEPELRQLTEQAAGILEAAEKRRSAETLFLDISRAALDKLGVMRAMRQAFAGLLLGDLILRQVGKGLGLTQKLSVTDFILFLAARVFDREGLPKMDRAEAAKLRAELEKALREH